MASTLVSSLEARFSSPGGDFEATEIFGGSVAVALPSVDARNLTDLAQTHSCGYSVNTGHCASAVQVTFDPTAGWSTPLPFSGPYWPGDVVSALSDSVVATELCRRAAGSTRVVRFSGPATVPGPVIDRIMSSPHVVDVRFRASAFDVLLARESPTLGGLSHLVATKKIGRPRRRFRRRHHAAVKRALQLSALPSTPTPRC